MITPEVREELRAWLRSVSPMTAFALNLRGEGPGATQQGADASKVATEQAQKVLDHFEGIDLDELPENVRASITKARETITQQSTSVQTATEKLAKTEQFARQQQSEADRLRTVVKRHNLDADSSKANSGNLADAKFKERVDRLVAQGLKPEAAEVYAKMLSDEAEVQRKEIISELGPLAGAVGGLQAQQVLSAAETVHEKFFAIPEVAKSVRDNVAIMVQNGNPVNDQTIQHLLSMAYGEYAMTNPTKTQASQEIPRIGGGGGMGSGGGHVGVANQPAIVGAPRTTQPETVSIVNALNAHMRQGLTLKK